MDSAPETSPMIDAAEALVRTQFGFSGLRDEQRRALVPILDKKDTVVVMPTGSGKSLCYQIPALLDERSGVTVVISPLIALMKDQVDALVARGFRAATLNSSMDADDRSDVHERLRQGRLSFIYVAPERLANQNLLAALTAAKVARVAVDEAHCASEWGHDFRPDYLKISEFTEKIGRPPLIALTATATPEVRRDIVQILGLRDPEVVVAGFDRPNISCFVRRSRGTADREKALAEAFRDFDPQNGTALVYAGSRKNTEIVAGLLKSANRRCGIYHAGLASEQRSRVQEDFIEGRLPIVVATNAFGMGIDRSDVRLVVHWDMPGSLEAYYQEIGRAGRDGRPSRAVLIFSEQSVFLQEFFLEMQNPAMATIVAVLERLQTDGDGAHDLESIEEAMARTGDGKLKNGASAAVSQMIIKNIVRRRQDGRLEVDLPRSRSVYELIDERAIDRRREHSRRKLQAMAAYARRTECRRNVILDYFEADRDAGGCGRCDACISHGGEKTVLTDDQATMLKKILAGIARAKGHAGRQKIIGMLTGSSAKEVRDSWLAQLSTYGILRDTSKKTIDAYIDAAVGARLIEIAGEDRPVLSLTEDGWSVMTGKKDAELALPKPSSEPDEPEADRTPREKRSKKRDAAPPVGMDDALFEKLRAWRRETAESLGVPAYVILHNSSLEDLAVKKPRTEADLRTVHGFGPQRTAQFGAALLRIVDEHLGP